MRLLWIRAAGNLLASAETCHVINLGVQKDDLYFVKRSTQTIRDGLCGANPEKQAVPGFKASISNCTNKAWFIATKAILSPYIPILAVG